MQNRMQIRCRSILWWNTFKNGAYLWRSICVCEFNTAQILAHQGIRTIAKAFATNEGRILLNSDLIIAPKMCIEYVIVHELCHLKEHNHGNDFYNLLKKLMPDWERRRERLNKCVVA